MRIAQVAPLYERVPPRYYGGTERIVSFLTEELVTQGHEVTLFASGDSVTAARLVSVLPNAQRLDRDAVDDLAPQIVLLEHVCRRAAAGQFDVIHLHNNYLHFPFSRRHPAAHVTTMHGRLDIPEYTLLFEEYREVAVVSISDAQRPPDLSANWQGTVHHGLPRDLFRFEPGAGSYFAFLGRMSPEKRVDRAIAIATRLGMPLRIAAKIDASDRDYFNGVVRPLLRRPGIEFVGEIGEQEKQEFLGNAHALLFPIDWPEPFGLVMIEALACGTPVIAWRCGSVPEVLDHGRVGFIVTGLAEAIAAARRIPEISRRACREHFERHFTAERMASDYLAVYERVIGRHRGSPARRIRHARRNRPVA